MPECSNNECEDKFTGRLIKCSACKLDFCKTCGQLTETEMRCLSLRNPKLKFLCINCDPAGEADSNEVQLNNASEESLIDTEHNGKKNNCPDIENVSVELFISEIQKLTNIIQDLKKQVDNLKLSNIDLVKTITSEEFLISHTNIMASTQKKPKTLEVSAGTDSKSHAPTSYAQIARNTSSVGSAFHTGAIPRQRPRQEPPLGDNTRQRNEAKNTENQKNNTNGNFAVAENLPRVKRNNYKNTERIGSAKHDRSNGALCGAAQKKMAWFYVGKIKNKDVTADEWLKYLKEDNKDEKFIVEKLKTHGSFAAFKIGAPFNLLGKLNDEEYWPAGVVIRRFNIRHKGSFLEKSEEIPKNM